MSGAADYLPVDDWAELEHPEFLANVRASVEILGGELSETYHLVRAIMQHARQEFGT